MSTRNLQITIDPSELKLPADAITQTFGVLSILTVLCDAYPKVLTKEELAAASGYEPGVGGYNNAISRLRTLELLQGRGEMTAATELF